MAPPADSFAQWGNDMTLAGKRVLIIGATQGIGRALARLVAAQGAELLVASRNASRVAAVVSEVGGRGMTIDLTDAASIADGMKAAGRLDHLAIPGSEVVFGSFRDLSLADAMASMLSKFWGPYQAVRAAEMAPRGSVVLFSGNASRKPIGAAALTAINSAVEGLGRALALELAPVRVNTICPGLVDTEMWQRLPAGQRDEMMEQSRRRLPARHVASAADIAELTLAVMTNRYMTGSTVDVDGGALIA
jgi:NAD(P)-dependent dehydrogenase (short-subunit alcohol dehydrogenase family)